MAEDEERQDGVTIGKGPAEDGKVKINGQIVSTIVSYPFSYYLKVVCYEEQFFFLYYSLVRYLKLHCFLNLIKSSLLSFFSNLNLIVSTLNLFCRDYWPPGRSVESIKP